MQEVTMKARSVAPLENGESDKNGENGRKRLVEAGLFHGLVELALERGILEARAEAGEVEVRVLGLRTVQRVGRLGVAAELGVGAGQREIERRIAGIADTRILEQLHRVGEALLQEIGDAEVERVLGADSRIEPHRQLAGHRSEEHTS